VFGSVSFGLSAGCGTCLPNGCAVATHSQGDWTESAEGDPDSLRGRSPHLAEARSGFWKGERASEGRGCFERGTLNADRKANRKGAALFQRPFLMPRVAKASSEYLKCHSHAGRKNDKGTKQRCYRSAHLLAFSMVLRIYAARLEVLGSRER
jgi:hypothetical protein